MLIFKKKTCKNSHIESIPLTTVETGTSSVSESLSSELSELELLELLSLRAPSSLFIMTEAFTLGRVLVMDDDLEGAVELIVGNVPDDIKGQSSLSEPIIGKLAKADDAPEDCTGELKFRVFSKITKNLNIFLRHYYIIKLLKTYFTFFNTLTATRVFNENSFSRCMVQYQAFFARSHSHRYFSNASRSSGGLKNDLLRRLFATLKPLAIVEYNERKCGGTRQAQISPLDTN